MLTVIINIFAMLGLCRCLYRDHLSLIILDHLSAKTACTVFRLRE